MHTLEEAKNIKGPIVYGLFDDDGLFYIGKTINARKRFRRYQDRTLNASLKKRLSISGDNVRVKVLVRNPPNLEQAESDLIMLNSGKVLNRYFNRLPRCTICNNLLNTTSALRKNVCFPCRKS